MRLQPHAQHSAIRRDEGEVIRMPRPITKNELEEVHRRLCLTIRRKTDAHAAIGRELDKLHAEAEELEYQLANYDDDDDDATPSPSAGEGD